MFKHIYSRVCSDWWLVQIQALRFTCKESSYHLIENSKPTFVFFMSSIYLAWPNQPCFKWSSILSHWGKIYQTLPYCTCHLVYEIFSKQAGAKSVRSLHGRVRGAHVYSSVVLTQWLDHNASWTIQKLWVLPFKHWFPHYKKWHYWCLQTVVLKVWSPDQLHQHLLGTCLLETQILRSHPRSWIRNSRSGSLPICLNNPSRSRMHAEVSRARYLADSRFYVCMDWIT